MPLKILRCSDGDADLSWYCIITRKACCCLKEITKKGLKMFLVSKSTTKQHILIAKTKEHIKHEIQAQHLPNFRSFPAHFLRIWRRNFGFGWLSWVKQQSSEQIPIGLVWVCICAELLLSQQGKSWGGSWRSAWLWREDVSCDGWPGIAAPQISWQSLQQHLCHSQLIPEPCWLWHLCNSNRNIKTNTARGVQKALGKSQGEKKKTKPGISAGCEGFWECCAQIV